MTDKNIFVYADNAATTKVSDTAVKAMIPCFQQYYGNPSSLHMKGQEASELLDQARKDIASVINAAPEEIIFTAGGSEADNQALISAARYGERKGKKHIISSAFEHHAVLHTLDKLKKQGFDITLLPIHENGIVRIEDLREAIRPDTCLVSIMFANNEIGTLQPIKEIGALCRSKGIFFHTDAVQAVGHVPIDVKSMFIDMLSMSGHKFHAPKGVGALFVRKGIPISSIIEGGAQERKHRAGTENLPGICGMATALLEADKCISENSEIISNARKEIIEALLQISYSRLNGDAEIRVPGTINICFEGIEGESLLLMLDSRGIEASSGSACTSGSLEPSHVLLALGLPHEIAHGSLRLSIGEDITREQIEHIKTVVPEVVDYLRNMSPVWDEMENGKIPHLLPKSQIIVYKEVKDVI